MNNMNIFVTIGVAAAVAAAFALPAWSESSPKHISNLVTECTFQPG